MHKVVLLITFRDDVDHDEARLNWRTNHAQITASSPGVVRYVQNHWTHSIQGVDRRYDGSVEIWCEDEAAFDRLMSNRDMYDDAVQYFDVTRAAGSAVTQYVLHDTVERV